MGKADTEVWEVCEGLWHISSMQLNILGILATSELSGTLLTHNITVTVTQSPMKSKCASRGPNPVPEGIKTTAASLTSEPEIELVTRATFNILLNRGNLFSITQHIAYL